MAQTVPSRIARVDAWKCVIKLPEPFKLGHLTVSQRDYVVVRVTTEGGMEGVAFGLGRGAPVDVVVTDLLAPQLVGKDLSELHEIASLFSLVLPQHAHEGLVMRALSLLDIALWDIRGKLAAQPVWQLLGAGGPQEGPILLVEGYHLGGEDDEAFADRLGKRAAEGYTALKVEASTTDHEALTRRLVATLSAVGPDTEVVIDLAYGWPRGEEEPRRAGWFDLDLAWAEDPMHGNAIDELARLHKDMPVPLAVGDEVTNPEMLVQLIASRAIDVVRLDLTCHGGFSGLTTVHQAALQAGIRVSTHVYPELHRHVVCGLDGAGSVEMFPDNGLWDATHKIIAPVIARRNADGIMVVDAPTEPGLGLQIDWGAVEKYSVRHSSAAVN